MQKVVDKISQVGKNAIIIAVASLASRLLGLFRDRVLASEFGAGQVLDTYYAAFRIPDFVFNLLILGALSAAFIPVFSELLFKDEKKAWKMVNNFMNIVMVVLLATMLFIFAFAPWIMILIAPGFNTVQLEEVTLLTRVMLLSPIFFSASSIIGGTLNSFGKFFAYSLAPILYNIGIISGAMYLVPIFGNVGLAIGVVAGAFAHMAVQVPAFFRVGYRFQPILDFKDKYILKIIKLMIPVTIGLALVQINLMVDNIIGSTLEEGSISIMNFATNLISLPVGLVGISCAVSVFPVLSYAIAQKKEDIFIYNFNSTFRMLLYLLIPAMIFCLIFRAHVVRLILGAGLFDVSNTVWTARAFGYLSLGIVAQGVVPFLTRCFYAISDTKTPVKVVLVSFAVNAIGSIFFTKVLDFRVAGLAIAFTIAAFVNLFLLLVFIKEKFHQIDLNSLLATTSRFFAFGIVAGLAAYGSLYLVEGYVNTLTTIGLLAQTVFAGTIGIFVYLVLSAIFKVKEAQSIIDSFAVIFRKITG